MMCNAEVTGSLVPTVAKQMQSVDPVGQETHRSMVNQRYPQQLTVIKLLSHMHHFYSKPLLLKAKMYTIFVEFLVELL